MSDETHIYSIPEWDTKFETSESRKLKKLTWIAMNTLFDTDEYAELTNHPSGASHLGAWLAVVMTAAKSRKRGTLIRANGQPHTPESLALITRLPATLFEEALPRLVEIGLLGESARVPGESARVAEESAGTPVLQDITGHNKTGPTGPDTTLPNTTLEDSTPPALSSAGEKLKVLEERWSNCKDPTERAKYRLEYQAASRRVA